MGSLPLLAIREISFNYGTHIANTIRIVLKLLDCGFNMIKKLFKVITAVSILHYLIYSQIVLATDNSVISQLRYDLWYNGLKISSLGEEYDAPDVVEAQEQADDQISYPIELTIPLFEEQGAV